MKFSSTASLLAAAGSVAAGPIVRRDVNDYQILNYALTLEHLEAAFYKAALAKFSAADFKANGHPVPWFYHNVEEIAADEATHVTFLTNAIKGADGTPVEPCQYNFDFPSVKSFLQTAAILEGVGVTAYLGAANLISNPDYLTAAGSILTVEARHSAIVRGHTRLAPFAAPFDVPLDFDEVYTLASPFIKSCPSNGAQLPALKAFPSLTSTAKSALKPGDSVTLTTTKAVGGDSNVYYTWITGGTPVYGTATAGNGGKSFTVKVPASGVNGQSYVVLTSSQGTFSDDNVLAGPGIVEVYAAYQSIP